MSLSSAKAKLDAQGGDPVTGYISKTDHQESYDELVDDTALTGSTTAEALDVTGALTAGSLVLGTVTHTEGTGSPQSVVSAPVGSTYIDTAATTGAIRWIKATGTGNTGWVVEYGDTGWRNLTAVSLLNGWTTSSFYLRRVGNVVNVSGTFSKASTTGVGIYTLPSGFRCTPVDVYSKFGATSTSDDVAEWFVIAANHTLSAKYTLMTGTTLYLHGSWLTTDAWPSSLPGSA